MSNPLKVFQDLWRELFSTPVHLDSALSRCPKAHKSTLARLIYPILLRPVSLAEELGVGVAPGEPWSLEMKALAEWKPAQQIAERLHERMSGRFEGPARAMVEDFPPWMVEDWSSSWGPETMRALIQNLSAPAPLSLRARRGLGAQGLLNALKAGSKLPVRPSLSKISPLGVTLDGYAPVMNLDLFQNGSFEIQDEGSQVMALFSLWPGHFSHLLGDRPSHQGDSGNESVTPLPEKDKQILTLVDACAGAGGKSLALADLLDGKGRIFAYDTSERKLQALRRRATKAGLTNIQAIALKDEAAMESMAQKFSKTAQLVLADAPCSGWGVLRRNPDIKWRQSRETLERMPGVQDRILDTYSELVAPGGRLVYGVCTFRREETTVVVDRFLEKRGDFDRGEGGFLGPGSSDGFFMQALVRKG